MTVKSSFSALPIVIGIPTFRRPDLLAALLDSLLPELRVHPAHVVVADNDCGADAPQVVAAFRARWPHIECAAVSARGISQVRNAIVRHAHNAAPNWQWLVMFDDDGVLEPGCLGKLIETGERFDAHLVGGYVDGQLPASANLLARNSIFAARRAWPTGLVQSLNGAQNLAISRKLLELVPEPLFRNEYGASGGEDYEFFRRVRQAQGRLAWCNEAVVLEPTPATRLTIGSLLSRYASTGSYMVRIDQFYDGQRVVWQRTAKGLLASTLRLLNGVLTLQYDKIAISTLSVAHFLGRLGGLLGFRSTRYVSQEKKERT